MARQLARDALAERVLVFAPRLRRTTGVDLSHRDAARDGAHEHAEVAADALVLEDLGQLGAGRERDRLMRAVLARDVAEMAADALRAVDRGHDRVVEVEVTPVGD